MAMGGIAGTVSRYFMAGVVHRVAGASFPYGTLTVNVFGCFLLGFLASLAEKKMMMTPEFRLLLMIGFCGAFTTFSTFIFETDNLIKDGETLRAFINIFVSVLAGFAVFRLGSFIGEMI